MSYLVIAVAVVLMEKHPIEVKHLIERFSASTLVDILIPVFIKGQEIEEFREGSLEQLLSWYFHIINCPVVCEHEYQDFGVHNVDTIMRILSDTNQ